jgi:hypothetical protein
MMLSQPKCCPILAGVLLLVSTCLQGQSLAPQVVGSGGAVISQGGVQLSYTIGEVVVASLAADTLLLTQGYQQSWPDEAVSVVPPSDELRLQVFPNPFYERIILRPLGDFPTGDLVLRLTGASGQLALERRLERIPGEDIIVLPGSLPAGAYTLQLFHNGALLFPARLLLRADAP